MRVVKIGITGGIGSGKTFVAGLLARRGIPVYSTDAAAKRLMKDSESIRRQLKAVVGDEVYRADGSLNKELLSDYLFADSSHARKVNAIVHPVVRRDFLCWASAQAVPVVAMECAILYESGFDQLVDEVLLVVAPEAVRIRRTMARDGLSEAQVRARVSAQMKDEERVSRAKYVIHNDGVSDVGTEVDRVLSRIMGCGAAKD